MVFPFFPNQAPAMDKLSAIKAFIEVANAGSFTVASAQLSISSSAVTKSVSRLEQELGVRLLTRTTHGVSVTEEGAAYLERCTDILENLIDAERQLLVRQVALSGSVRIGMPHAVARRFVTPALPEFFRKYPDIKVELVLVDQVVDLVAYKLDIAVRIGAPRDNRTVARELAQTQRVTIATPAYLAAHGRPGALDELRDHNCLCLLLNGRRRLWRFSSAGYSLPFVPKGNFIVNSGDELREAALQGIGIAQINSILVERELQSGTLEPLLVEHTAPSDTLYALYAQNRYFTPRARAFLDFLLQVFAPFKTPTPLIAHVPASRSAKKLRRE
jgi:LysR family transcriptional regulator for bpeEF and oprC